MTYRLEVGEGLDRVFLRLAKKDRKRLKQLNKIDRKQLEHIGKGVAKICENPYIGKPLRRPLQGRRRVHVGSFVLVYSVDEARETVRLIEYEHHDRVY